MYNFISHVITRETIFLTWQNIVMLNRNIVQKINKKIKNKEKHLGQLKRVPMTLMKHILFSDHPSCDWNRDCRNGALDVFSFEHLSEQFVPFKTSMSARTSK